MFKDIYRSMFTRFVEACAAIFAGALLIYLAVQLIAAVLIWLIITAITVALLALFIWLMRWNGERW